MAGVCLAQDAGDGESLIAWIHSAVVIEEHRFNYTSPAVQELPAWRLVHEQCVQSLEIKYHVTGTNMPCSDTDTYD